MADRTIVVSRSTGDDPDRRALEDAVIRLSARAGVRVLAVPHVYHLEADDPAALALCGAEGDLAVGGWLHPRAMLWTLEALGVRASGRDVRCVDLGACGSAEQCARLLVDGSVSGAPAHMDEAQAAGRERWYPVLDYSLCTHCGRCLDFCLFGVYAREDGRVVAAQPGRCKPGCPACARVCPEGAIMFPLYAADPGIAGAPGARPSGEPIDVERFFQLRRGGLSFTEPCPVCGCACDCQRSLDGTAPPGKSVCPACGCICESPGACGCGPDDDIQDLMQALDEFDD